MTEDKEIINEKVKLNSYKDLKKIIPFYRKHKGLFIGTLALMLTYTIVGFFEPIVSGNALAFLSELNFEKALIFAGLVIVFRIMITIFTILYNMCYHKLAKNVSFDLKNNLVRAICRITIGQADKTNNGIFIERLHDDTRKCSDVLMDLVSVFLSVLSNIGFIVYIGFLNFWFFLAVVAYVLVLWFFDSKKEQSWFKKRKKFRKLSEMATGLYNEEIRGLRDIKCLNITENSTEKSNKKYKEALLEDYNARKNREVWVLWRNICATVFEVGFFVMGIFFIKYSLISLSGFLIIYMYHSNARNLSRDIAFVKQYCIEGEISAQRIFEIIDKFPKEQFGNQELNSVTGNIEFVNVTFGYNKNKDILKNISLKFEANKSTAIVGKSGSGKSTILSLIDKLYVANSGTITLDNININNLSENALRNSIGLVNQTPYLFNFSIRENLLLINPKATEAEMIKALQQAQIYDFIQTLDNGIDSVIGENGVMLSGGQKQRLAIARILLKNSPIIMLDEATSALDNESQERIVDVIDEIKKDHTIIIVAHRLSTIIDADSIIVLDKGRIIAQGTHKELIRNCELYRNLYKKEETENLFASKISQFE